MSHIEIPDGVLPIAWWLSGYMISILFLVFIQYRRKWVDLRYKIPLLGIVSSMMLIGMSLPLGFIPFHVNLATLAGILLGSGLGFIASFVSVFFLSLIGHGGITMVGINSITVGIEAIIGGFIFKNLKRIIRRSYKINVFITTLVSLIISISFLIFFVVIATSYSPLEALKLQTEIEFTKSSILRFLSIIAAIATIGISTETFVTTWIIGFIGSVRPDILEH